MDHTKSKRYCRLAADSDVDSLRLVQSATYSNRMDVKTMAAFVAEPWGFALIASDENSPILGYCFGKFIGDDHFAVTSVTVCRSVRRVGVATFLVSTLQRLALKARSELAQLTFSCVVDVRSDGGNQFFRSIGAKVNRFNRENDLWIYRWTVLRH